MGWDGILFLYEDNSVTERSVDAWKEHGLRYNSSPWHALKTIVRLLTTHVLPTRWDPGNEPSHLTANCEVVKIACSKSPCPCMYFFTVCPWRFCFGFDNNIQTILRARVMLQTRIQGWICNASFRDIIVMIRAVWIYHSANTFTFWAFIELC